MSDEKDQTVQYGVKGSPTYNERIRGCVFVGLKTEPTAAEVAEASIAYKETRTDAGLGVLAPANGVTAMTDMKTGEVYHSIHALTHRPFFKTDIAILEKDGKALFYDGDKPPVELKGVSAAEIKEMVVTFESDKRIDFHESQSIREVIARGANEAKGKSR